MKLIALLSIISVILINGCIQGTNPGIPFYETGLINVKLNQDFDLKYGETALVEDTDRIIRFVKHVPNIVWCNDSETDCEQCGIITGIGDGDLCKGETDTGSGYSITLNKLSGWGVGAIANLRVYKTNE